MMCRIWSFISCLFKAGATEKVIIAAMAPERASMHLDTVFTFLDADKATAPIEPDE